MHRRNRFFALLLVFLPIACTGSSERRAEIHGEVTLDGAPIAEGSILFFPTDATKSVTAGTAIENGKYHIAQDKGPGVGFNRVEIRASRKSGNKVQKAMGQPGELMDEMVEAVAPRFNAESELRVEVMSGANTANFAVASK